MLAGLGRTIEETIGEGVIHAINAVDRGEFPVDGATIVDLLRLRDRIDVKLTELVGTFDAAKLWDLDAATSMAAWLTDRAGMTVRDAARLSITAKRLRLAPVTMTAWRSADLSGGQVSIVIDRLGRHRSRLWADHEAAMVPTLVGLSMDDTARALDAWRSHADADGAMSDDGRAELHHTRVGDRWRTDGDFDALDGELIATALRIATHLDDAGEPVRTPSQKRGDALVDVCKYFLDHQTERRGRRHRPHVNVVVTPAELATGIGGGTLGGTRLGARPTEMLLCDAVLHRVVIAEGEVLDYGRSIHTIPAPLYNAVAIRDQHCRFPGCDRPGHWCDAHHVRWFSRRGPTSITNLVLLCRRHHQRLHQLGWHAKLLPDGTFEVTDGQGRTRESRPPPRLAPSSRGQPPAAA